MVELSVPIDFMCPISLEVMKDPVTLSTGQTYDRRSIEKWFATGHNSCPSTMQVIDTNDVAPNTILQRLIRRWCVCNNVGAVAVPHHRRHASTPNPGGGNRQLSTAGATDGDGASTATATWRQASQILEQVALGTNRQNSVRKLKSLAMDSNHQLENRRALREAGAIPILAQFAFAPENLRADSVEASEMALGVLALLLPLQNNISSRAILVDSKQLTSISWFLNRSSSLDTRVSAAVVLGRLCQDDDEVKLLVGATAGVFEGLVQLLKEDLYPRARDAALKAVVTIISGLERNMVRSVEAGVVFAVAELLPDAERRGQDRPLTELLELLCSCAEGKQAVSRHSLIVPMLVRIISQRQVLASESAISCLWTVCQFSPGKCLDEAAGQAGILIQLWTFCRADDSKINPETRRRAADLLRLIRHKINHCDDKV